VEPRRPKFGKDLLHRVDRGDDFTRQPGQSVPLNRVIPDGTIESVLLVDDPALTQRHQELGEELCPLHALELSFRQDVLP
jgi:hypothetical protein